MFKVSYFLEVLPIIASKVNITFELTIAATIFALIVGVIIAIIGYYKILHAFLYMKLLHQKVCCLIRQVILINGQIKKIRQQFYTRFFRLFHPDLVIQVYRLHHHPHIVITVLSPSQNIQTQINLSKCFQFHFIHLIYLLTFCIQCSYSIPKFCLKINILSPLFIPSFSI